MITGVILTRNNEQLIARAITSLRRFDEILICDTHSVDKTLEVAQMFGCRVIQRVFELGFATMKNKAVAEAKHDHVFVLDADEYIDPDVYYELKSGFSNEPNCVYRFNRLNMYDLKNYIPEWYPDPQTRAYNKKVCKYEKEVHEVLRSGGCKIWTSKYKIYHNLCDDRKRNVINQVVYSTISNKGISRDKAKEIVQKNVDRPKKPVEELERGNK